MSGLVDMWTSEWAKLREKGNASSSGTESVGRDEVVKEVNGAHQRYFHSSGLAKLLKLKSEGDQVSYYSEATIQMIMECFSP
ncbi:hypothetical protein Syun_004940 [Stephania yunnanensis]|uniref:Uncharacterized protein n=1 Tax=Stephania yunnanensis TaxID=152371 RepID=A0AAP0L3Y1_9MAGN